MTMKKIVVKGLAAPMRLDKYLRHRFPAWGRKAVGQLIAGKAVLVNGRSVYLSSWQVKNGDRLDLKRIPEAKPVPFTKFEDGWLIEKTADLIAVNKPAGLLSQPTQWQKGTSLLDLVQNRFGSATLFHRLDRDTSGVVLFSTSQPRNQYLDAVFQQRLVVKEYMAVVKAPNQLAQKGEIRLRLGRDPKRRDRMVVVQRGGQGALTKYEVVGEKNGRQLVKLWPVTGRTHQLRLHLAHLQAPILGDRLYGKFRSGQRLHLHARQILLPSLDSFTQKSFVALLPQKIFDFA
ncbi:MAG: RluA family pseudouridine synthase [Chloroflexota bacterium]